MHDFLYFRLYLSSIELYLISQLFLSLSLRSRRYEIKRINSRECLWLANSIEIEFWYSISRIQRPLWDVYELIRSL